MEGIYACFEEYFIPEELDVALGNGRRLAISQLGKNTRLYNKYLARFMRKYFNSSKIISNMLSQNKRNDAYIYCISLKGLAATLGLSPIADIAGLIAEKIESNDLVEISENLTAMSLLFTYVTHYDMNIA